MCPRGGVASLVVEVANVVRGDPLYFEAMIVEDAGHQGLKDHFFESGGSGRQY